MSDPTVFGPGVSGPERRVRPAPVPVEPASMLVNVTFRVALSGDAASAPVDMLSQAASALMENAVRTTVSGQSGVRLDGAVAVTAAVTRS